LQEPGSQLHPDVPPANEQRAAAGIAANSAAAGNEAVHQSQSTSEQPPPAPFPPTALLEPDSNRKSDLGTENSEQSGSALVQALSVSAPAEAAPIPADAETGQRLEASTSGQPASVPPSASILPQPATAVKPQPAIQVDEQPGGSTSAQEAQLVKEGHKPLEAPTSVQPPPPDSAALPAAIRSALAVEPQPGNEADEQSAVSSSAQPPSTSDPPAPGDAPMLIDLTEEEVRTYCKFSGRPAFVMSAAAAHNLSAYFLALPTS